MKPLACLYQKLHCWLVGFVQSKQKSRWVDLIDVFYSSIPYSLTELLSYG